MNVVRGKVLAKEQGHPVPDVLVVAYDLDRQSGQASTPAAPAWDSLQSDRLGSVLTDDAGEFELSFEDDLFRRRGESEQRPDLALFVLAPEDTQEDSPQPAPSSDRVLHYSTGVRAGAGRTESYIIRIPSARLVRFGIPYGPAARRPLVDDGALDPAEVMAAVGRRLRFDSVLGGDEGFRALLRGRRDAAFDGARRAQGFAAQLVGRLVPPLEGHRSHSAAERPQLQARVVDQALARVGRTARPFFVPLDENTARDIEADPSRAAGALGARATELDRVRVRTLLEACQARRLCRQLHSGNGDPGGGGDGGGNGGGAPGGGNEGSTTDPHVIVLQKLLGQLDDLPFVTGRRADALGLQEELDALKLRGGPADVTSFHDFHTLQIAFKSVWEAVYDDGLIQDGAALYEDWVRVRTYLGRPEPTPEELAEFRSLRDFLRTVERDLTAARGLSERTGTLPNWEGNPSTGLPFPPFLPGPSGFPGGAAWGAGASMFPGSSFPGSAGGIGASSPSSRGTSRVRTGGGRPRVIVRAPGGPPATGQLAPPGAPSTSGVIAVDGDLLVRLGRIMTGLAGRLREPYAFDVFAPDTVNFGLLVTYRQRWEPESYQVGELVATMPLAPGEKRTFSTKQTVRKLRAEKEVENALSSVKGESSHTSRADAEIVRKASSSTNFKQTAQGQFSLGDFLELESTTEFAMEQGQESEQSKKDFHEAVRKATEEYKRERTLEVSTTTEQTVETTSTGEIANPNNEIPVTYLFYQLQRRYRVSEQLYRARPVVLVAQEVPKPEDIDEDWLLTHEWILRRAVLDDSLHKAFDYLKDSMAGDEFAVEVLRATWERNFQVVDQISRQLQARSELRDQIRSRVLELLSRVQADQTGQDVAAAIFSGGASLLFGKQDSSTSLAATQEAASRELEFTESEFAEAEGRLRQAVSALEVATDKYVAALRAQLNHRVAVDQLRVHVKENILHYMQQIWAYEPPDQRFFRLYNQQVPWTELEAAAAPTLVRGSEMPEIGPSVTVLDLLRGGDLPRRAGLRVSPQFRRSASTRPLVEVADLDTLLGFKGNYLIFPLRESNPLVEFMLAPYRKDDVLGVLDPDDFGNYTTEELEALVQCLKEDDQIAASERDKIIDLLCQRLAAARRDVETIIVPTGQLYIESLPGAHPVLEDYKLLHRAIDVKKAQAEVRELEIENLRRADRLIAGDREDPDVDRRIQIQGSSSVEVDTE